MEAQKLACSETILSRLCCGLFPFDFRGDFGPEMEQTFREQRVDAQRDAGKQDRFAAAVVGNHHRDFYHRARRASVHAAPGRSAMRCA